VIPVNGVTDFPATSLNELGNYQLEGTFEGISSGESQRVTPSNPFYIE
jgi:hypothetical protein